jgi:hypothetical protein
MSLGRLLAAGKSLVGTHDGAGRYRVNKHVALPKFISPRNPFARPEPDAAPENAAPPVPAVAPEAAAAPPENKPVLRVGRSISPMSAARRAARWLDEWRRKANPWVRFAGRPGPVKSRVAASPRLPVQSELSLDNVRVVRNDLSDADFEIVPRQTAGHQQPGPARLAVRRPLVSAGHVWDRLATRIFGPGQP